MLFCIGAYRDVGDFEFPDFFLGRRLVGPHYAGHVGAGEVRPVSAEGHLDHGVLEDLGLQDDLAGLGVPQVREVILPAGYDQGGVSRVDRAGEHRL